MVETDEYFESEKRGKIYRKELTQIKNKYGHKNLDLYIKSFKDLKKKYSVSDRWGGYTFFIDDCLELGHYDVAIEEWNNLMEEEWYGFNMRWKYHDFHLPYLLKFEYLTKQSVVSGQNVFRMGGWKKLTNYGVENIEEIKKAIDILILKEGSFFKLIWWDYNFDVNYSNSTQLKKDVGHTFRIFCKKCLEEAEHIGRSAENYFRKNSGIPEIGEGWVSETHLYYEIKKLLSHKVIHHGRPKWLGRQHFDIWIPSLNIAVEYQGAQHDRPVDFFGGEEAFKKNQRRDETKKKLCMENNVRLIEVREGYKIKEIIKEMHMIK